MATLLPVEGIFSQIPSRFLSPAWGFASGWNYWLNWALTVPTELTAVASFMAYWVSTDQFPSWAWSGVYLVPLALLNLTSVKYLGEAEFFMSLLKVISIVIFLIVGTCVWFGAGQGSTGPLWFTNWSPAIVGDDATSRFVNISSGFITAFYAYGGTEMIGVAASEAANPRKSVPRAVKGTFWRINIFYIAAIFLVGLLLPPSSSILDPNNPNGVTESPFVYVYNVVGIKSGADIMNAVIIIAVVSAANSSIYACSRTLMRLADEGSAPSIFRHVNKRGVPIYALGCSIFFGALAVVCGYAAGPNGSTNVFNFFSSLVSLGIMFAWMLISWAHLRFRAGFIAQGRNVSELPYVAPFYPYADYLSLTIGVVVTAFMIFGAFYNVTVYDLNWYMNNAWLYGGVPLSLVFYIVKAIYISNKSNKGAFYGFGLIPYEDMDFDTGRLVESPEDLLSEERGLKDTFMSLFKKSPSK
ncbi:hypothetical protein HDU99_002406 [Rhizoclosmatium hyalinum]|nr:hypothetical protein HDU99_002406 [Rhizoclosmatium hyalinum]